MTTTLFGVFEGTLLMVDVSPEVEERFRNLRSRWNMPVEELLEKISKAAYLNFDQDLTEAHVIAYLDEAEGRLEEGKKTS